MVCSDKARKPRLLSHRAKTITLDDRTLENLPMRFNKTDSMTAASKCRETMSAKSSASTQAERMSHCQLTESRRLFGDVLSKAKKNITVRPKSHQLAVPIPSLKFQSRCLQEARDDGAASVRDTLYSSCSMRSNNSSTARHTGPTSYGSPLYNTSAQSVYDRLHLKASLSDAPPEYFRANPDITKCLKQSNSKYRVSRPVSDTDSYSNERHSARDFDKFSKYILIPNKESSSRQTSSSKPSLAPVSQLLRADRFGKLDIDSIDIQIPGINIIAPLESEGKYVHDSFATQSDSNLADWRKEADTLGATGAADFADQVKVVTFPRSKKSSSQSKQSPRQKIDDKRKEKKGKKRPDVAAEEQLSESHAEFPAFICPSSETKSREAYCRTWIRQNTFTKCDKYLPLE